MSKLTETTLLPLSLVITIIGGVVWLSVMYQKVEAHEQKLSKAEVLQIEIIDRLARIETKQDALLKHK